MTTPWRKVIRDFLLEGPRTLLVVLAIALGIIGFSTVLSTYAVLTRELNAGYLATNPASATLRMDAVDDQLLATLLTNRELSDAQARRIISGQIKAGPGEWRNLQLFVVKDYSNIRVSKLTPEQGAWPPGMGEILLERDALQVARAQIGDTVTVKTTRGNEHALRLTGSVHDVGQAQARMENVVYGYITLGTLVQLGEEPFLDQLQILVAENRFDETHIRDVAAQVKTTVENQGHPVRRIDIPRPGKHPHADIMGFLLLAMATFGFFILALSGILVVNLLMGLMASQVRQIGMMKAIGGTRWRIARIYLSQAMLLGIAALVIALPVGNLGSRMLSRAMAVFLNFDITSFAVPLWVYALVAGIGLAVPLLAAGYPVWKGTGITVREALADFGVGQNAFGTDWLDRALAGMGGVGRPLLLAIRNSFRRRTRLALTLLTLAVGGLFFMAALNVRASMVSTLDHLFDSKRFDLSVSFPGLYSYEKIERAIQNTGGIVRAEGWIVTEGTISIPGSADPTGATSNSAATISDLHGAAVGSGDRFAVVALPSNTQFLKMEIMEGRGLEAGDTNAIVVNGSLVSKFPQVKLGNEVAIRMGPALLPWRIVGITREPFSPPVAYISRDYVENLGGHQGMANVVHLVLEKTDPVSLKSVKTTLDRNLELEGLRASSLSSKVDSRYGFDQHMLMIYVFLIIVSCILAGVGGLGLSTTMSLNVLERRREMGVLRVIGASPRTIWLIVAVEGCAIGVLSWALAALLAWPVSRILGDALAAAFFKGGLDFVFEMRGVLIWLAISIFLGAVASFLPAWHAARVTVREALSYE
jgi:putative ABC transport system permease protein